MYSWKAKRFRTGTFLKEGLLAAFGEGCGVGGLVLYSSVHSATLFPRNDLVYHTLSIISTSHSRLTLNLLTHEEGFYEVVEVAVKDVLDVGTFDAGAGVFDEFVGVQDIVPDLGTEVDFHFAAFDFVPFRVAPFDFRLVELRL